MRARIGIALGPYWGGIVYIIDVIAAISALGAIGALPPLLHGLTKYARLALKWLRGRLRLPIAVLFSVSLLTLQGCAQTAIREPASSQWDAPNAIRTLGADQVFTTLSSRSVARRLRAQRAGQPVNILALSGAAPTAPLAPVRWSVLRDRRCGPNIRWLPVSAPAL